MIAKTYCLVVSSGISERGPHDDQVIRFNSENLIQRTEDGSIFVEYAKPISVTEEVIDCIGSRTIYRTTIHWLVKYHVHSTLEEWSDTIAKSESE